VTDIPMKPQDQIIYMLGELRGQVGALQGTLEANASSQAVVNASHAAEHLVFRQEIAQLQSQMAVIDAQKKPPSQWWSIAAGVSALVAVIITLTRFFDPLNG
jgi:hypothetical protein